MLDVQTGGDAARACRRFAAVRASLLPPGLGSAGIEPGAVPPLYWSALRGEVLALSLVGEPAAGTALLDAELARLGPAGAVLPDDLREQTSGALRLARAVVPHRRARRR
jgi:hypothetical protein